MGSKVSFEPGPHSQAVINGLLLQCLLEVLFST